MTKSPKTEKTNQSATGVFLAGLMPETKLHRAVFGLILISAVVMGLIGIGWGLPEDHFTLSLYETETETFEHLLKIDLPAGELNPGPVRVLALNLYVGQGILLLGDAMGLCSFSRDMTFYQDHPNQLRRCFLVLRLWMVLWSALGLVFIFGSGRVFYNNTIGLWSMGLAAIAPIRVTECHFFTHQMGIFTFIALVTYLLALALSGRHRKFEFAAVIIGGISGGVLINGLAGAVIIPVLLWYNRTRGDSLQKVLLSKRSLALCASFASGFFLAVMWQRPGFQWFFDNWGALGTAEVFYRDPLHVGFFHDIFYTMPFALGWGFFLLAWLALGWAIAKRRSSDIALLAIMGVFFLAFLIFSVSRARYVLHFLAPLSVMTAALIFEAPLHLRMKNPGRLTAVIGGCAVAASAIFCFALLGLLSQKANTAQASDWMKQNVPSHAKIALLSEYRRGLPGILNEGYFGAGQRYYSNVISIEKDLHGEISGEIDYVVTYDLEFKGIYDKYMRYPNDFPQKNALAKALSAGDTFEQLAIFQGRAPLLNSVFKSPLRPLDFSFNLIPIRIFKRLETGPAPVLEP